MRFQAIFRHNQTNQLEDVYVLAEESPESEMSRIEQSILRVAANENKECIKLLILSNVGAGCYGTDISGKAISEYIAILSQKLSDNYTKLTNG